MWGGHSCPPLLVLVLKLTLMLAVVLCGSESQTRTGRAKLGSRPDKRPNRALCALMIY